MHYQMYIYITYVSASIHLPEVAGKIAIISIKKSVVNKNKLVSIFDLGKG